MDIIGSVFRSTAIVTGKDQSAKDDEENISSIQSSPKKSAGHSMDSCQVGDNCPFCEERERGLCSFLFCLLFSI